MFSSLKKLKIFFILLSVASVIASGVGGLYLSSDAKYLVGTYSVVVIGYIAVILLPLIIIGITVFLHLLDKELEAESCSVTRRIAELEKQLEKNITNKKT